MSDQYLIDGHKAHLHPQRIAQWLDAGTDWEKLKKVYPIYVEIAPCGQCNHRCSFCAVDYIGYKNITLEHSALHRCLTNMAENGVKSVMYAGEGEPLLAKGIGETINHTKNVGIDVAITTNATPLSETLAQECLQSITWLKASINGGTAESYSTIHRTKKADFDRVLNNLAAAVKWRNTNGLKTTLGAQIVLLPENKHTVVPLCEAAQRIGLDYVVVKPYSQHPSSSSTAELYGELRYDEFVGLGDQLRQFNTDKFKVVYRERTMATLSEPGRAYTKCHSTPMFWAYIMASGDVYGCGAHLLDEKFKYGNIYENSFSEIWEGDKRRQSVEYVRDVLDISVCRKNCRMEHVNRYLWELKNPQLHTNFI